MFLQRKALYNLIQLNLDRLEKSDLPVTDLQPWQTEDYRAKSTEHLISDLMQLGVLLRAEDCERYMKSFEGPEEVVEALGGKWPSLEKDRLFLLIFELWRRLYPEKRTLSIFCDELDHQMIAHDLKKPSEIQDLLLYLQQLLDEHVDKGFSPKKAFDSIQVYCANDIEDFLFDYILEEIEAGHHDYARELLDGFAVYLPDSIRTNYLLARAKAPEDPEEGFVHFERVMQTCDETTDRDLVEEILFFLATTGNHPLFCFFATKALDWLEVEEDLSEFLEACYAHFDYLEQKEPALAIAHLYHGRAPLPPETPLATNDPVFDQIRKLLAV